MRPTVIATLLVLVTVPGTAAFGQQPTLSQDVAELTRLTPAIKNGADSRQRNDALHRVWRVGVTSIEPQVKLQAINLLAEPANSGFDQVRMPAMYAISEIARTTIDANVKTIAIARLANPLKAAQVPVRLHAVSIVEAITANSSSVEVTMAAVNALAEPIGSGNNGVRMPAMMSLVRIVGNCAHEPACNKGIDLLLQPLRSTAGSGGMEVRMLAVANMEQLAINSVSASARGKVMGLLMAESARGHWEPEAVARVQVAVKAIQARE